MPGIGVVARRESLWDIGRKGRKAAIMHQLKKGCDSAPRKLRAAMMPPMVGRGEGVGKVGRGARAANTPCPKPHQG